MHIHAKHPALHVEANHKSDIAPPALCTPPAPDPFRPPTCLSPRYRDERKGAGEEHLEIKVERSPRWYIEARWKAGCQASRMAIPCERKAAPSKEMAIGRATAKQQPSKKGRGEQAPHYRHNTSWPSSSCLNLGPSSTWMPPRTHSVWATLSSGQRLLARLSRPSVTSMAPLSPLASNLASSPS